MKATIGTDCALIGTHVKNTNITEFGCQISFNLKRFIYMGRGMQTDKNLSGNGSGFWCSRRTSQSFFLTRCPSGLRTSVKFPRTSPLNTLQWINTKYSALKSWPIKMCDFISSLHDIFWHFLLVVKKRFSGIKFQILRAKPHSSTANHKTKVNILCIYSFYSCILRV